MKKILIVAFFASLLSLSLFSSVDFPKEMGYEIEYEKALEKAKKEKKPILLVVKTKTCPWCKKLERQTLKKEAIHTKIIENFIPLTLYKKDLLSKGLNTKVVPTVYFISSKDEKVYKKSFGYKNRKEFGEILDKAIEETP